jgi:hypothetical protein
MLLTCQSLSAEVKIIKLNYAEPDSVILTLNQLFGKKVKVAAAPMINAVVINSDDKDVLAAIDQLIRDLDHRPALLRFSVQRGSDQSFQQHEIRVGQKNRLQQTRTQSHETGQNSVIALEYRKARLTDDSIRIFSYPTYFGEAIETIIIARGLMVSGHLTGNNSAQIEVWYSTGEGFDSETLLTELEAPLGQWVSLGGSSNENNQSSPEIKIGKNSGFSARKSGSHIDRRYLIKVDLVKD